MKQDSLKELLNFITKVSSIDQEGSGIVVRINGCADDKAKLVALIDEAKKSHETMMDYRQYFDEVKASPMYKPENFALAVLQVAKKYDLNSEQFKLQFKSSQ